MRSLRRATLARETPRGVELDCGDGFLCRISFLDDRLARVMFTRAGALRERRTWSVLAPCMADVPWEGRDRLDDSAWPAPALIRDGLERDDFAVAQPSRSSGLSESGMQTYGDTACAHPALTIGGPGMSVRVSLDPFRLEWRLPDGRAFMADRADTPYMFARRGKAIAHYTMRHPDDRYYGLGDKTGALDLHGRRLRTRMVDALGYDARTGDPLYKHWPFVITRDAVTGACYGVYYDNMASASFDLGCEYDNYHGLFRGYEAEDGDLDFYVLLGPALREVTPRFLALTGHTALPPRWTLGYAQTAMAIADAPDAQARMSDFIDRCAHEDVPISSFHMGSGYTSIGPKRYVYNWNTSKFPDPAALMRKFHGAGMHVVANLKPCLLDDHPRYAEAKDSGAFVTDATTGEPLLSQFWDGEGAYLDFTSPAGIAWWQDGLRRAILDVGIDVGWNDNNEYELWDDDAACAGFGTPMSLVMARPVQPLLMTRATLEAQAARTPGQRAFTITRAGCPGIQRYAQTWSGDNMTGWHALRWNMRTGLQMTLSGMYNVGHDVGGFGGPLPDPEMLTRWTQMGLLHPRFIMNSWKPDGAINCPWLFAESLPAIRAALRLRYRLIPYLYSLMHAATRGEPILRPTFLEFDADPRAWADCDEMLVGGYLLAAPVVEPGARTRTAYLPAGPEAWIGFDDGAVHAAGSEVTVEAPLDHLPLFARAGAIVPMTDEVAGYARLHDEPSRVVRIYPGPGAGESRFLLMEDDGLSAGGPATRVECRLSWTQDGVGFAVASEGDYALPYVAMTVRLPPGDGRRLTLAGDARIALRA